MRPDHARAIRQRFLRFLRDKTDHRDHLPAMMVQREGGDFLTLTLLACCFLLAAAAIERNEAAVEAALDRDEARLRVTQLEHRLGSYAQGTSVRIIDAGYRCQVAGVRREWEVAVASKCEQLASMLRSARTGR